MQTRTNRDDLLHQHPLVSFLQDRGVQIKGDGTHRKTNRCAAHEHDDKHLCVSLDTARQLWHCNDCDTGGTIIDWLMISENLTVGQALAKLDVGHREPYKPFSPPRGVQTPPTPPKRATDPSPAQGKPSQEYTYTDINGEMVYQVVRMEPKSFRQRRNVDDQWVWNMDGVARVLYRLHTLPHAQEIWITEGEKDVDSLVALGFVATCNVGGAGKWMDSYSEYLKNKDVVICGDTDKAGQAHVKLVSESLAGHAKSVRIIKLPGVKDVSDFIATGPDKARKALEDMRDSTTAMIRGFHLPIYSMVEMEQRYKKHILTLTESQLRLDKWLPSLRFHTVPPVPGDLVMVIAQTGVGKTHVLSNIALHARPLPTLFFELELPEPKMYERTLSMATRYPRETLQANYLAGDMLGEIGLRSMDHMHFCTESKITIELLEFYITHAELKMGCRPKVVMLDYIQLMNGAASQGRYEKTSMVAEELKVLAKATQTIIVVASQVARKPHGETEVFMQEGKDSGSIENSCGLLLGTWRDEADKMKLYVKVLKNSDGTSGAIIPCTFSGIKAGEFSPRIVELDPRKIDESDIPRR